MVVWLFSDSVICGEEGRRAAVTHLLDLTSFIHIYFMFFLFFVSFFFPPSDYFPLSLKVRIKRSSFILAFKSALSLFFLDNGQSFIIFSFPLLSFFSELFSP